VAGDLPAEKIHEDDRTIAFMDVNPGTRGHALVIPKNHTKDLLEIDPDELAAVTRSAQTVSRRAMERLEADGINLLNCCGSEAWQTVFHFHIHVVPRYVDDPLQLPWIPAPGEPDEIAQTAKLLRD
jgi:Diadenosine tetraphosphate (Ap4A) hydrolase and other HIT family hydrolases